MIRLVVRAFLSFFWFLSVSVVGLVLAIFRYGDIALDQIFARIYGRVALRILGIQVEYQGAEILADDKMRARPSVIVANHQSGLDVPVFAQIYPRGAVIIGKKELMWIPLFGFFFKAAGNILIDRKHRTRAVASLGVAVDAMRSRGLSVWIFPEGTRNRQGHGLLPFKRGAFHMAIQAGCPVIPVVTSHYAPFFDWKRKWIARRGFVQVRVLDPIESTGFTEDQVSEFAEHVRQKMLAALQGDDGRGGLRSRCE